MDRKSKMPALDSIWDLRQSWQVQDLKSSVLRVLSLKKGKSTRQVAGAVEANHAQTRRILLAMWDEGTVVPEGDRRSRLWFKC